jgi:hypothetical protein
LPVLTRVRLMARSGLPKIAAAASLAAVATSLACGTAEREPGPGYLGRWEVIGFDMPGFHTLSAEESEALVGSEAVFSEGEARFGERGCRPPAYEERDIGLADFGIEYRVDPALLDLSDPVQVVEVGCAAAWTGAGSSLILRADGSLLTVWEGVFFELARVNS